MGEIVVFAPPEKKLLVIRTDGGLDPEFERGKLQGLRALSGSVRN